MMPDWTWRWASNGVLGWARIGSIEENLTGRARLGVVIAVLGPALRRDWVRPLHHQLFGRLPVKVLLLCLVPAGHGWYRVPDRGTVLHAFFRLGVICRQGGYCPGRQARGDWSSTKPTGAARSG